MTKTIESLSTLQHYEQPIETVEADVEREPVSATQLREEYQKLRQQFLNRQLGITTLHGSHVYEDDVMATRFHAQHDVEEVWWASQDFSHRYKDGVTSSLSIQLYDDEGEYARLLVTDDDRLQVNLREEKNNHQAYWRRGSEEEVQDIAFSIMHRASDARSTYQYRSPAVRQQSDQHAKELLGKKYPNLAASERTVE